MVWERSETVELKASDAVWRATCRVSSTSTLSVAARPLGVLMGAEADTGSGSASGSVMIGRVALMPATPLSRPAKVDRLGREGGLVWLSEVGMEHRDGTATVAVTQATSELRIEIVVERRRTHDPAFRAPMVRLSVAPGASVQELAWQHGLAPSLIYRWAAGVASGCPQLPDDAAAGGAGRQDAGGKALCAQAGRSDRDRAGKRRSGAC